MSLVLDKPPIELEAPQAPGGIRNAITALLLFGPIVGVVVGTLLILRHQTYAADFGIAAVLYIISGHGVTAGYHRMLTHRAFKTNRLVKIALVFAGSLSLEGGALAWVANHRQHHAYTDVQGDPHSPHLHNFTVTGRVRAALHSHVGWLFGPGQTVEERNRWIPDLLGDKDLQMMDRLFPLFVVISFGLPALLGWAFTGTAGGAFGGFIWGGLVRVFLLQQSTFAVNSACHLWGKKPFVLRAQDQARNFAPLALLAMGENWHNLHHAAPTLARHGVDRFQLDSTALLIWSLEKMNFATEVKWPDYERLATKRQCNLKRTAN